jgi:hypothetical protein
MTTYIQPDLETYDSFNEFLDRNPFIPDLLVESNFSCGDFFKMKGSFVIAEPGNGKTRLLKEVIVEALNKKKQGIFIDLKKVDRDLESFISEPKRIFESITPESKGEDLKKMTLFKTEGFSLENSEETMICLDALDEIKQQDFSNVVDWIKYFSKQFTNTHILISCRVHHLKKYSHLFSDMDFKYIHIDSFSNDQIRTYLEKSGLTEEQIKRITEISESGNRQLPLDIPRYLEMVIDFIGKKGIDDLKNLTRGELFEFFIYGKLEIEDEKINQQFRDLTKRVLEKLALLMEMYQANTLTKDELMTFFDDVKSDLKNNFWQQIPLQSFYDRSLLKDNVDTIEFENTGFQEYLAAKEIKRLGRTDQIIFDLAVDKELREIYPSWLDTLGFLIDLDISILKPILEFGYIKGKLVETDEYYRLLTTVDTNRLTLDERKEIFKMVFVYYQDRSTWIMPYVAKKLSYYFDVSQNDLLKECVDKRKFKGLKLILNRGNVAEILSYLFENEKFNQDEIEYWKKKLIEFTKEDNSALHRRVILALSKLKDLRVIEKVSYLFNKRDELTTRGFLLACIEIDSNDPISIRYFVKGKKRDATFAQYGLERITEKRAVKHLLDYFIEDDEFLLQFIDPRLNYHSREYSKIFLNIRKVYDSDIEEKIETIIKIIIWNHWVYSTGYSPFWGSLVELIKKNNKNFLYSLISEIKKMKDIEERFFDLTYVFSRLLEKVQIGRFIEEFRDFDGGKGFALRTLRKIKYSDRNDSLAVYEEGRKYFEEDYRQYEEYIKEQTVNDQKKVYEKFKFKLEPEKGKYYPDVFSFYLENKESIEQYIKDIERERLIKLTISFFDVHDPEKQRLFITEKTESGSMQFKSNWAFQIFGDCILIANEFNIDLSKYKKKIIGFIPYAEGSQLEIIFSSLPKFSDEDINVLLRIYEGKRKDDLADFNPENIVKVIDKYKIVKAIPVLKRCVDKDYYLHVRKAALNSIANINPDEKYFNEVFEKFKTREDESYKLAEEANKHLIEKHSNSDAIRWRFEQLIKRIYPFEKKMEIHRITDEEKELSPKEFAQPLWNLKDTSYLDRFINLLDKSFEIYKKGAEYREYAQYMWEIIVTYFKNLKENRYYGPLNKLEDYVLRNSSRPGINWFADKLRELKREYLNYIGKSQYFSDCIKKYNWFKEQQYLEIAFTRDLFEILQEVIENDLRKWVEDEGAYRFIREAKGKQEDLIQKTIKTQFENSLLKRGLRNSDIIREPQLLDDYRPDFLIYYGFIGPVLIEIKRLDNAEVKYESRRLRYSKKLKKYMEGKNSDLGIYIIFKIKEGNDLDDYLKKVLESFGEYNRISVIGLDCIKGGA